MALLVVLVILMAVGTSSASFIWFMNQQQTRAGARFRGAAALAAAEAGVHRALAILESVSPDNRSPGRTWRPTAYSEMVQIGALEGRYTLSLTDEVDGAVIITSVGQVADTVRRLRARVYLASPALLAALHGTGYIRLERPPAAMAILPYGAGIGDRPWIHIAAGREIWFATTDVSINDRLAPLDAGVGPVDLPHDPARLRRPGPIRLLLARSGALTLDEDHLLVDVQQLRLMGLAVEGVVLSARALPPLPDIDERYYQALAAANTANSDLNEAAGRYFADNLLERKRDSLYTAQEFERVQAYLGTGRHPPRLKGVIYIKSAVTLLGGQRLQITDGTLVTEGTVHLTQGASLEITHSAATRTLPGILALGDGGLIVTHGARLRVHGLVFVGRTIDIGGGAHVEIVGSALSNDPGLSFRNIASTVIIRYDPAVLGTPGLRMPGDAPILAWIASWEELP